MNKAFAIVGLRYNPQLGSYFNLLTWATLKQYKNCYSGLVNNQRMKFTRDVTFCEDGHSHIDPKENGYGYNTYYAFDSMAGALAYIKRNSSYGARTNSIQSAIDKFTQALADGMSI